MGHAAALRGPRQGSLEMARLLLMADVLVPVDLVLGRLPEQAGKGESGSP